MSRRNVLLAASILLVFSTIPRLSQSDEEYSWGLHPMYYTTLQGIEREYYLHGVLETLAYIHHHGEIPSEFIECMFDSPRPDRNMMVFRTTANREMEERTVDARPLSAAWITIDRLIWECETGYIKLHYPWFNE